MTHYRQVQNVDVLLFLLLHRFVDSLSLHWLQSPSFMGTEVDLIPPFHVQYPRHTEQWPQAPTVVAYSPCGNDRFNHPRWRSPSAARPMLYAP